MDINKSHLKHRLKFFGSNLNGKWRVTVCLVSTTSPVTHPDISAVEPYFLYASQIFPHLLFTTITYVNIIVRCPPARLSVPVTQIHSSLG